MKKAFLTGITGQDGSFLTELLLNKGYEVHGLIRRASNFNTDRIDHLAADGRLKLYHGDMTDSSNLNRILEKERLQVLKNTDSDVPTILLFPVSKIQIPFYFYEITSSCNFSIGCKL